MAFFDKNPNDKNLFSKYQSHKSILIFAVFLLLALCLYLPNRASQKQPDAHPTPPLRIGVVFDKGGKDDKSFNTSAYLGLKEAEAKLGVQTKWVEASSDNAFEPFLQTFARHQYDLIIGVGFVQADAIRRVASRFPQQRFALVDSEVQLPNVRNLMFAEHEGSFLVGAMAAMVSRSAKLGFVGGMEIPLIHRFQRGYAAGAQHINPQAKIYTKYLGLTGDAWNNPPLAKTATLAQVAEGVDVVFSAAGASGAGVFDAAEDKQIFAIGCDSNQNWIKPGRILTSMLKRVDIAVYSTIEDLLHRRFTPGTVVYSLKNQGIDVAMDEYNASLVTPAMHTQINNLKMQIIAGTLIVPDYYLLKK